MDWKLSGLPYFDMEYTQSIDTHHEHGLVRRDVRCRRWIEQKRLRVF